ncbi:MAG: hypothetical protein HY718_13510, partial [Planctomycetes bacterium]|nr:hypothetical protein [Planctomycetota bacterium]
MTPARRARGFALLVLAAAVGAVGACGAWAPVPTTVETVAGDTYASFQPVTAAQHLLEGVRARERDLLVYARDGRVKDFSADEADRGTILRFEPPADVAEIVACGLLAPKMRILRTPPADPVPPRPPDPRRLEDLGEFKITFYWVALEEPAKDEPASTPLYDPDGKEIGRFTDSFVRRVTIEGTGKLRDGRVINVSGRKGTFEVVRCPNGLGTGGYHLI